MKTKLIAANTEEQLIIRTAEETESCFEITVGENSQFSLTYFENRNENEFSEVTITITLKKNAHLDIMTAFAGSRKSKLKLKVIHEESGSSSDQKTLFFGDKSQNFDIESTTILDAPDTTAKIIAKGVLNNTATASFDGSIHITHNGKNANAHLNEHTLLLSSGAKINAVPALKIANNQVQASHSASVTRVDDEHLFYCGARGIDESSATKMIVEGFLRELYQGSNYIEKIEPIILSKIDQITNKN